MAAPTATATVVGGPIDLTAAARLGVVAIEDTGDPYTPAATGRTVKVNGVALPGEVGVESTLTLAASGTYPVLINVVNDDGNDDSVAVDVVITDDIEDTPLATYTPIGGAARVLRKDMPREYGDGSVATAGLPTISGANAARYLGDASRVADADTGLVLTDRGEAVIVDLS